MNYGKGWGFESASSWGWLRLSVVKMVRGMDLICYDLVLMQTLLEKTGNNSDICLYTGSRWHDQNWYRSGNDNFD